MKKFIKIKYFKRLLTKFKIHNKKRSNLILSHKRLALTNPNYNKLKKHFILNKKSLFLFKSCSFPVPSKRSFVYSVFSSPSSSPSKDYTLLDSTVSAETAGKKIDSKNKTQGDQLKSIILKRKKFYLNSYLNQTILRLSRKYDYYFLGKEIFRQYYTSPFRVPITQFIINKWLLSYYKNLSYKALLNLRKRISHPLLNFNQTQKEIKEQGWNKLGYKKELAKNLILNIEQRLDNSILRLLHFRSNYSFIRRKNKLQKFKTFPKIQLKSFWGKYSALQIKQFINHGHILLNNRRITRGGYFLKPLDKIELQGFIPHNLYQKSQNSQNQIWIKNQKFSILIRNFPYIYPMGTTENENVYDYIQNLKIKRFTEIFYITYKNMHLIQHDFFVNSNTQSSWPKDTLINNPLNNQSTEQIETDLQDSNLNNSITQTIPIFANLGHNQSVYILWPIINMVRVSPWNSKLKQDLIKAAKGATRKKQNKNQITQGISGKWLRQSLNNLLIRKYRQNLIWNSKEKRLLTYCPCPPGSPGIIPLRVAQQIQEYYQKDKQLKTVKALKTLKSYASIVYGTKICSWVKLQQGNKRLWYNKIHHKNQFFDMELKLISKVYQYYRG